EPLPVSAGSNTGAHFLLFARYCFLMGRIEHYPSDITAGFLCMTWTGFRFFCGIFSDIVWIGYWTLLAFWITLLDYPFCFDARIYRFPVANSLTVFSFALSLSPVPRMDPASSGAGGAPLQCRSEAALRLFDESTLQTSDTWVCIKSSA
ncbi:MAG: hypothetical protein ACRCX7_02275, partial [Cetobacterium sp.]|uniref:hypothetical protein n=1 Tax=Cetobacterium sp. TaxID=2071632 RepID=UPI003F3F1960